MDRRGFMVVSAGLVSILSGCMDDGDGTTPTDNPSPTPSPTEPMDSSPTATSAGTGTPTATETTTPIQDADQTVIVGPDGSLRFEPASFSIGVGDSVLWRWDSSGHNVSPTSGEIPSESEWTGDDESTYGAGHVHHHTFSVAGQYDYHCDPHQSVGMTGSFTVA